MSVDVATAGPVHVDNETIGARLQVAGRALGLTQTDAGKTMDMATSTVSAIEAGKRTVSGAELYHFAHLYGRPVSYFLDEPTASASNGFPYLYQSAADGKLDRRPLVELEQLAGDYDLLEELVSAAPLPLPSTTPTLASRPSRMPRR